MHAEERTQTVTQMQRKGETRYWLSKWQCCCLAATREILHFYSLSQLWPKQYLCCGLLPCIDSMLVPALQNRHVPNKLMNEFFTKKQTNHWFHRARKACSPFIQSGNLSTLCLHINCLPACKQNLLKSNLVNRARPNIRITVYPQV